MAHICSTRFGMPPARSSPPAGPKSMLIGIMGLVGIGAESEAHGAPASGMAPQAQAKVHIRVSVRPVTRVRQLPVSHPDAALQRPTPTSWCYWSNADVGQYILRAEWNNGHSSELEVPMQAESACRQIGMQLVRVAARPDPSTERSDRIVTLVVSPQ